MVKLVAQSPLHGLLPVKVGSTILSELEPEIMTAVMPLKGQPAATATALKAAHGLDWPEPGKSTSKSGARAIWFGRDTVLLTGRAPDSALKKTAALVDQSDAWAVAKLEGPQAEDVLARLVPVNVGRSSFKRGHTMRTELAHMAASVTRIGPEAFQLMVFRAFAGSFVHEVTIAMEGVAARESA